MPHSGQTGVVIDSGGYQLFGTLYLAPGDAPKPTALLLHGMPGIEKNVDVALTLRATGWNALIFHYRGVWGSQGVWNFKTMPEDVSAAIDQLRSGAYPQIHPNQFVVVGHSMGGWTAVLAAAQDPRIKGVAVYGAVSDHRFTWSEDLIEGDFLPWMPGLSRADFDAQWAALDEEHLPLAQAGRIGERPFLILHGMADDVVPPAQAEALFKAAGEPAGLVSGLVFHPTANHSFTNDRRWIINQIRVFCEELRVEWSGGWMNQPDLTRTSEPLQGKDSAGLVRYLWWLIGRREFEAAAALMHPHVEVRWPQSGEVIRERVNWLAINQHYPGEWSTEITRIHFGGEDQVSVEVLLRSGEETQRCVAFYTVRGGLILKGVEYWPDPMPAAEWRRQWVEPGS